MSNHPVNFGVNITNNMLYLSHDYIWSLDQRLRRLCGCWPLIICSHHVRFGYMRACEIRDITSYILHITPWLHDFVITWFCDFVIPWLWVWYTVHCVKVVQIWSFFWSIFSEPEKTPYLDTFYAVVIDN